MLKKIEVSSECLTTNNQETLLIIQLLLNSIIYVPNILLSYPEIYENLCK